MANTLAFRIKEVVNFNYSCLDAHNHGIEIEREGDVHQLKGTWDHQLRRLKGAPRHRPRRRI
jgi:hypothetical protein